MSTPVAYGGQAVIEGVMMRGGHHFAVACRRANGEIVLREEPVPAFFTRYRWARWPFFRGVFALADALVLGMKSLMFSADLATRDMEAGSRPAAGAANGEGPTTNGSAARRSPAYYTPPSADVDPGGTVSGGNRTATMPKTAPSFTLGAGARGVSGQSGGTGSGSAATSKSGSGVSTPRSSGFFGGTGSGSAASGKGAVS